MKVGKRYYIVAEAGYEELRWVRVEFTAILRRILRHATEDRDVFFFDDGVLLEGVAFEAVEV